MWDLYILIESNNCEIISEIELLKNNFAETEIPKRMIKYGRQYVAEIIDDETGEKVWAVLEKRKGVWCFNSYYDSLKTMIAGI